MSSKWPAKLFSYHPRVPVSTDAEEEAPPAPSPESVEASSSPPVLPEPNHAATEETTLTAPVEHEARLVERARTHPEAFGQLYELYVDRAYSYIYHRGAMFKTPKT
ncbi:MAG: hypothetical protein IPM07_12535 [Anaerolineales bacterium]|nr:hypothetical protein [Anaerolineales bacterium]